MKNSKKKDDSLSEEKKQTSGISLMKHNRLRVLSESSSNKIISSKNDLVLSSNDNFIYKKDITIAEKINQLKHKKYYLRKNNENDKTRSNNNDSRRNSSNNNDFSMSDNDTIQNIDPITPSSSYNVDTRRSSRDNNQSNNALDSIITDPSTLAQPIRQELQIKAKESMSDIILACRSLIQSSNVSNNLSKAVYNFSLLDSVFSDIDNSITKINQNLSSCKQKNEDITKSLEELNEAQEGSRRVKDLIVAYITE
ncbi:hypothetical protein BCR36DRAFT_404558 [Piromyces finnis]|uniref:BLOC-1-related complex subunit 7 n=1 Tax=Piromyces finnis TaxID=1754191 RepID=A0A1Y1V9W9_9FUNG|nr:hypothetical protein BCR36DRAFT_404558 [Piromyces finnis]|eukprot:ORX49991.1 hypothetical protein BCR36DRAFT_404558 [Piromyces finnis]